MKALLVNYNYDPTWLRDYPQLDVTIRDRSDDGKERNLEQYGEVTHGPNIGDVDADKLDWLVENYYNLPDVFLWGKTNLLKYVDSPTLSQAIENNGFTPLLKQDHKTYSDDRGVVCFYGDDGMYHERNDSWYFNAGLDTTGHYRSWADWAYDFHLPNEPYIPFPPGGNYILTKERVHRNGQDIYAKMRDTLPYAAHPVEAHCCERSYFYLWR